MTGRGACLLVIVAVLATSSCDSVTFDPFDNDERYFTVFGFLDELSQNHAVRVIPVTRRDADVLDPSSGNASIDATVVSTNLRTGTVTRWEHNLERLDDGTWGHIFRSRFFVNTGHTYRLDVIRSDSVVTSAEAIIPRLSGVVPEPAALPFPYESSPESGLSREVYLPGIASPWEIILDYDLQGTAVRLNYGRPGFRTENDGWRFTIDMGADAPRLREALGISESTPLPLLHAITLQVRLLDPAWDPPKGVFDPEVLAQPGALSNVENGYGIWAGMGIWFHTWSAPPSG